MSRAGLGSDRVEEREAAERRLRALGPRAVPDLRRAAQAADPEIAGRARTVLRFIELGEKLGPKLRPLGDRLARGGDVEFTKVFLELADLFEGGRGPGGLRGRDLEPLAGPALRGAASPEEKLKIFRFINRLRLRSAAPEILPLLDDPAEGVRRAAAETWGELGGGGGRPLLRLLQVRVEAIRFLAEDGPTGAPIPLHRLLRDPCEKVRAAAAAAAKSSGAREFLPLLHDLLRDPCPDVRLKAADALVELCGEEAIPPSSR